MSYSFTSRPLKSGNSGHEKIKILHRKTSSNPFSSKSRNRKKSKVENYKSYTQEEDGSSIFHQLDPSPFPVTKLDLLWMESSASDNCCICLEKIDSKLFGTKKRHCKKCGRVVCIPCSDIRIRKHRVCNQCNRYYLSLNNILNLWYRTNRNINHSLCGYDSYTLDTCASLKRILFILNHYHKYILIKNNDDKIINKAEDVKEENKTKPPPFNITTNISMKQLVNRLPKYDQEIFINDIHHLKQMHFKNKQIFKISQYQKNHQWELRAYSWKKIGKCDRWGCQYGIKDIRNDTPSDESHKRSKSFHLDFNISTLLNNMHVILLHGLDDNDKEKEDSIDRAKELYDLLPQTPLSPHIGFFAPNVTNNNEDAKIELDLGQSLSDAANQPIQTVGASTKINKSKLPLTAFQEAVLSINIQPLCEIEWMDERHNTLCNWLNVCCYRFDFFSTNQNEWEAIQKKKQLLSDILDYLDMTDNIWDNDIILKSIMKMIKCNLFRSLPLTFRMLLNTPDYCQEDENDEFEDPNYPHLCYVYEIALMFVRNINIDDRSRKKFLGKSFIIPLTELFASEDMREREYLKAILHGIYARNMRLRRLVRQQMSNCCYRVIFTLDDNIENGISECLQLICSIIQGLTIPIKKEYLNILYNVLIPLHKCNSRKLHKYHETLLACCIQFILKDVNIGIHILNGLLKYWPHQSASKSDMFLKEIVIIINTMMTDIDQQQIKDDDNYNNEPKKHSNIFIINHLLTFQIIDKLVQCAVSENHCLSEKALLAFGELGIQKLIDTNKSLYWSKILYVLFDNRDNSRHWCKPLNDSFAEALDSFLIRDTKLVQNYETQYKNENKNENVEQNYFTKNIIYYGTLTNKNKINQSRINNWMAIKLLASNATDHSSK